MRYNELPVGPFRYFMATITTSDFSKGGFILFKNEPHQIVEFQHVNPGKGSAFVRTKLKSVKTGRVQEFTYKSGESVEELFVETREMQYLYEEGDKSLFMDNETFDQYELNSTLLGAFASYIKAGETYQILVHEGEAIGIRPPKRVTLTVTEAVDGAKGNTATSATKVVTVESGATVTVPLFIRQGEKIVIDPESGSYLERG